MKMKNLEGLEEHIMNGFGGLMCKREYLKEKSKTLLPIVLKHFNWFIQETVNPQLPEGYIIGDSEKCEYDVGENGYVIYMGEMNWPEGNDEDVPRVSGQIQDLFIQYQEMYEWVQGIK
jgi:hypothetical protein